jgi:FO synthase subunit 1
MGLMLEIARDDLAVHRHAPGKRTAVRLEQLVWAGELGIPFTTGLLLGIGEQEHDRLTTLTLIAEVHGRFGHIQEVILQPHSPGAAQPWPGVPFAEADLLALVAQARTLLPPQVTIQIPPNLVDDPVPFLEAGARDLGGIGPVDVVNPDYEHPEVARLAGRLSASGWHLVPRLPVYPQFEDNLPARLRPLVARWRAKLPQVE